ncbi:PREDICTED: 85/88 kDa calcium-independent phospholipase A2-like isoform X2 [Amphimedon queenslandica]|uniref:phospholipase A2 n=1 Tax=Amphimedon queenslandica TaxID=400682 RepID=A0AAN0JHR5_AMPQE|nr:PREDICTED: 85/88 kDa calcium-independent phospholipase A2-like isoform X2 [Amphimedon queenslandica]|eukprot:XP_019856198.1 PREDICTED: 85/88 kDa calcium-independent phospholipase A2-like isoform X2 [Amphimedon queenslandica]
MSSPPAHRNSTPSISRSSFMSRWCPTRGSPLALSSQVSPGSSSTRRARSGKRPRSRPPGFEEEEIDDDGESLPTVTDTITTVTTTSTRDSRTINGDEGSHVISSSFVMIQEENQYNEALIDEATCALPDPPRRVSRRMEEVACYNSPLHKPRNAKHVLHLLQSGYNPNQRDGSHDRLAPIHSIVRSSLKDRSKCLETLLVHGEVDVNCPDAHNMTALHFAAMEGDLRCIKLLLAFGADINAISNFEMTPMNLALAHFKESAIQLFGVLGGISAAFVLKRDPVPLPPITHFLGLGLPLSSSDSDDTDNDRQTPYRDFMTGYVRQSEPALQLNARVQSSFSINEEEAVSLILQQQEANLLHQEHSHIMYSLSYRLHNGSRILSMDGFGSRSVIVLETLERLMETTGQSVTDMFDIICGSSFGALIALGLVYGKRTIAQLRRSLYKLKDIEPHCSSNDESYQQILREIVGNEHQLMCDVKEPKVMVFAVNKATTDLKLHAFNNCFDDEFSQESVLTVAHYVSISPISVTNNTDYVSASLIANNPTDYALTRLQQFYYQRHEQCLVSVVVSLGTGIYVHSKMGSFPRISSLKFRSRRAYHRLQNFVLLLRNSLIQSDTVSANCASRCKSLGIPYYRFSPHLKEKVSVFETETRKLLNSVLRARIELQNMRCGFEELKEYFVKITKTYTASGSGLGGASCMFTTSDALSPSDLIPHTKSTETNSSDDDLQRKHFLWRCKCSNQI